MSRRAWVYIWTILGIGLVLSVSSFPKGPFPQSQWLAFLLLSVSAIIAQRFDVKFGRQSFYPHLVFFFAGVILLEPSLFILLVAMPHLVEWTWKRLADSKFLRDWYIQPFNISTHVIAGFAAKIVYTFITHSQVDVALPSQLAAAVVAAFTYALVNHLIVGEVLSLARGISWKESEILGIESLGPDVIMLILGYAIAALWIENPWLIVPVLTPLVLVYRALMVPQLIRDARIDQKTGLFNVRYFNKRFEEEFERAMRFERPLSVIMADLDLLRDINNRYGHLAGDAVIAGVAEIIQEHIRDYDIAGRFGGEEFALVLPEATPEAALTVAQRLRQAVESAPFFVGDTQIRVTMSIGVASYPADAQDMQNLLHEADIALYQAKFRGRNRVIAACDVPHSFRLDSVKRLEEERGAGFAASPEKLSRNGATPSAPTRTKRSRTSKGSPERREERRQVKRIKDQLLLIGFILATVAIGVSVALFGMKTITPADIPAVIAFAIFGAIAESMYVRLYRNATVSASATVILASVMVAGIPGAIFTGTAIVAWNAWKEHPQAHRLGFSWAVHLLASLPALLIHRYQAEYASANSMFFLLCAAAFIGLGYFLIESGLVATAVGLSDRVSILGWWNKQFRWLAPYYAIMGIAALFMAMIYRSLGVWGAIGFAIPIFLIHFSQKMYVEHTEASIAELQRMNNEMRAANAEIERAGQMLRRLNEELLQALSKISDARDPNTTDHASRVAATAIRVAQRLGLPPDEVETLRQASLLHDIGKLAVPERILQKAGKLTPEEFDAIRSHAAKGGELLETIQGLQHLAPIVRHHHERWDGNGYPDGLAGHEIPFAARILAACDAIDAMAARRPYSAPMSHDRIVDEMRRCAGKQFDPEVAEACIAELLTAEEPGQQAAEAHSPRTDGTAGAEQHLEPELVPQGFRDIRTPIPAT